MFLICSQAGARVNLELFADRAAPHRNVGEAIANKTGICGRVFLAGRMIRAVPAAAAYLESLNPEQRRAVEHGIREKDCTPAVPPRKVRVDVGVRMRGMWR
jgi:hypothetical protein